MGRATSLKALLGNLRFIVTWKTWAALVVFAAGVAVGAAWCLAAPMPLPNPWPRPSPSASTQPVPASSRRVFSCPPEAALA